MSGSSPSASATARKNRAAGTRPPAAVHGGRLSRRDRPVARVTDEVIEADGVKKREGRPEPGDPPGKPGGAHLRPPVERVPPALPGGAEVVGRHAGHQRRLAGVVEIELLPIQPDVGAVVGQKDRQVADEGDPARVGVAAQRLPVAGEPPLDEAGELDVAGVVAAEVRQRLPVAIAQGRGPAGPLHLPLRALDRAVDGEIVQPSLRLLGEPAKIRIVRAPAPGEGRESLGQLLVAGAALVARGEETVIAQALGVDQGGVPGERRLGAVRRIAVPGRADREHLPPALSGGSQEVDHLARRSTQILTGQAGRVQEHAAGSIDELWQAQRRLKLNVADKARRDFRLL